MIMIASLTGWAVGGASASPENTSANPKPSSVLPTISGNAGVAGALILYTGTPTKGSTIADENGDYSFEVDLGWVGTVTPSLSGYSFFPAFRTYINVQYDRSDQDYIASSDTFVTTCLPLVVR